MTAFSTLLAQIGPQAETGYQWDTWTIHEDRDSAVTGYRDRLYALSEAQALVACLAMAESIVAGIGQHDPENWIRDYVQSAWAGFSDTTDPRYFETDDNDWRGPQREMLALALIVLNDALFCRDERSYIAFRADWLLFYAQKLYAHLPVFRDWVETLVARLESLGKGPDDTPVESNELPLRPCFSRRFLDLDWPYDEAAEAAALAADLTRWKGDGNLFLN
jgi:hypothetical protein